MMRGLGAVVARIFTKKFFSISLAGAFLCLLTACSSSPFGGMNRQVVAEPDPVALRLAAAVDSASSALQTLASVEQARNPGVAIQAAPDAPPELRRTVSVDWVGPVEPFARAMADKAGYRFQVNGDRPPVPVVVSVRAREKSVVEILRDVGLQAGLRADVVVDPARRVVELNYAPVSGG